MGPEWLRRTKEGTMEVISRDGTTAQIDPLRFCRWLLARCQERGVQVHYPARALSVSRDDKGILDGIRISQNGTETECMIASSRKTFYSTNTRQYHVPALSSPPAPGHPASSEPSSLPQQHEYLYPLSAATRYSCATPISSPTNQTGKFAMPSSRQTP